MLTRDQLRSAIVPRIDRFIDDLVTVLHRHLAVDVAEARAAAVARLESALMLVEAEASQKHKRPTSKKKRARQRCGLCREIGHSARTCDAANGATDGTKVTKASNGTKPPPTKKDRFAQIEARARSRAEEST